MLTSRSPASSTPATPADRARLRVVTQVGLTDAQRKLMAENKERALQRRREREEAALAQEASAWGGLPRVGTTTYPNTNTNTNTTPHVMTAAVVPSSVLGSAGPPRWGTPTRHGGHGSTTGGRPDRGGAGFHRHVVDLVTPPTRELVPGPHRGPIPHTPRMEMGVGVAARPRARTERDPLLPPPDLPDPPGTYPRRSSSSRAPKNANTTPDGQLRYEYKARIARACKAAIRSWGWNLSADEFRVICRHATKAVVAAHPLRSSSEVNVMSMSMPMPMPMPMPTPTPEVVQEALLDARRVLQEKARHQAT